MTLIKFATFLFSPFGREKRLPYAGLVAWSVIATYGWGMGTRALQGPESGWSTLSTSSTVLPIALSLAWLVLAFCPVLAGTIRRLHDLKLTGWLILPCFLSSILGIIQTAVYGSGSYGSTAHIFELAFGVTNIISATYSPLMALILCVIPGRKVVDMKADAF